MPNDSNYRIDLGFNSYYNSYSDSNPEDKSDPRPALIQSSAQSGHSGDNLLKSGDELSTILVRLSKDQRTLSSNHNRQMESHCLGSLESHQ